MKGEREEMNNNSKRFFNECKCIEELKAEYKRLALIYHPDIKSTGDLEIMQIINAEYDRLFCILKDVHAKKDGSTYQATGAWTTSETPEQYRDIISALIKMHGVEIELCGSWLWMTGETMKYKEELKALGCLWSANKRAWYYNGDSRKSKKRAHCKSMDEIRSAWGSEKIAGKAEKQEQEQEQKKPEYIHA